MNHPSYSYLGLEKDSDGRPVSSSPSQTNGSLGVAWSSASSGYISTGCESEASCGDHVGIQGAVDFRNFENDNDEDDVDSDWGEEDWPLDRPLPLPEWGCERPELKFHSIDDYHKFLSLASKLLQENIQSFTYDTISNFIM